MDKESSGYAIASYFLSTGLFVMLTATGKITREEAIEVIEISRKFLQHSTSPYGEDIQAFANSALKNVEEMLRQYLGEGNT